MTRLGYVRDEDISTVVNTYSRPPMTPSRPDHCRTSSGSIRNRLPRHRDARDQGRALRHRRRHHGMECVRRHRRVGRACPRPRSVPVGLCRGTDGPRARLVEQVGPESDPLARHSHEIVQHTRDDLQFLQAVSLKELVGDSPHLLMQVAMSRMDLLADIGELQVNLFAVPGESATRYHTEVDKALDAFRNSALRDACSQRQADDVNRSGTRVAAGRDDWESRPVGPGRGDTNPTPSGSRPDTDCPATGQRTRPARPHRPRPRP